MPGEGPKAIPINLDFSIVGTYVLDYSNMTRRNFFSMLQTVFVDNFTSGSILTITTPIQVLKIPAGVQGYFPIICPTPIILRFDSAGGVLCKVILLNFPVFA
jgi:hypothetical protein